MRVSHNTTFLCNLEATSNSKSFGKIKNSNLIFAQIENEKTKDAEGNDVYVNEATKDVKAIKGEIKDVIRQITASVTFLPLLDTLCSFDILIYTHK